MVQKGQFLERPTLIPVGDVVLEALSHRGDLRPGLLVLPPSPDEGSMDHVVAAELVWAAATAGFPTLRFNYRGVGASQGRIGQPGELTSDAKAAAQLLRENTGADSIVIASVGGSGSLAIGPTALGPMSGLALVSPPAQLDLEGLRAVGVPLVVVVADEDRRIDRAALTDAVEAAKGHLAVIEKADAAFTRNLPHVGKAVVHLLRRLGGAS